MSLACIKFNRRADEIAGVALLADRTRVHGFAGGLWCVEEEELQWLNTAELGYRRATPEEAETVRRLLEDPAHRAQVEGFEREAQRYRCGKRDPAPAEKEAWVLEYFPIRTQSPEEWAAQHGSRTLVFGLHRYAYSDPEVDAWMRRLGEILTNPQEPDRCS